MLKIAQGGRAESSLLCLTSLGDCHTAFRDLGLALGSLGVSARLGPACPCEQLAAASVIFFKRNIPCEGRCGLLFGFVFHFMWLSLFISTALSSHILVPL